MVVQLLEGNMTFTVGVDTQELAVGDVVYLAPGENHAVVAQSPCRFALVMVAQPTD